MARDIYDTVVAEYSRLGRVRNQSVAGRRHRTFLEVALLLSVVALILSQARVDSPVK